MNPKIPLRHTSNHCPLGIPYQVEAGKLHLGGPIAINHTQTMALHLLVEEQITLGHIHPFMSPWNMLVFVIQKSSGAWHMLQDLHKIK